jgi:ketosteroid isomerase-like protein
VLATLRERTEARPDAIGALYDQDWLAVPDESLRCALAELFDPAAVFVAEAEADRESPSPAGIDAAMRLFEAARRDWASMRHLVERVERRGPEVVVTGRVLAEARESGSRAWFEFGHVWTLENGRVAKVVAHPDAASARGRLPLAKAL